MKRTATLVVMAAIAITATVAQEKQNFLRSSIYTVLIKSDKENAKLNEEIENPNLITSLVEGFKDMNPFKKEKKQEENADEAPAPTTIRSEVPQTLFPKIAIPDQFNDHNLEARVIDLDPLTAGLTKEEIETAEAAFNAKKSKGGKFLKGLGKAAASTIGGDKGSALISVDTISQLIPAAMQKYFAQNHTAEQLVAKWFDYNPQGDTKWDLNLVTDRGLYSATAQEKDRAAALGNEATLAGKGFDLLNKTFVIGINLRYRSNKAIMAEAQALANAVGSQLGGYGMLASQVAGAAAGMAVGNGYSVQANTYLYKLEWNDDIMQNFAQNIFDKNATLEDLINLGICKLIPVGKAKENARVRQSITNKRSEEELVAIATEQAIDKAISKLQEKVEDFRTFTPISGMGENGVVYARIGTKEGLEKNDEYEILEAQEDKEGRLTYKSVCTVKVVDKQIWENRAGVAMDLSDISDDEAKAQGINKDAVALGATAFKGAKKGQDYTGYLLRLKKKK